MSNVWNSRNGIVVHRCLAPPYPIFATEEVSEVVFESMRTQLLRFSCILPLRATMYSLGPGTRDLARVTRGASNILLFQSQAKSG